MKKVVRTTRKKCADSSFAFLFGVLEKDIRFGSVGCDVTIFY
jgi:hypothetical protein